VVSLDPKFIATLTRSAPQPAVENILTVLGL
jgi:hypothetical protein